MVKDLTPSLPQPVKFPGWMMRGRACKEYIFLSYIYFQFNAFWWKSFYMPVQKRRPKGLRVSNFALLWVVFKWPHGSEGVKHTMNTHRVKPFIMAAVKDNITGHRSDWSLLGTWEAIARAKVWDNCCTQNQPVILRNYQHLPKKHRLQLTL